MVDMWLPNFVADLLTYIHLYNKGSVYLFLTVH